MTLAYVVGVTGLSLIVIGWGLAFDVVPSWRLSAFYGVGSVLLSMYSYLRGDPIFLILNLAASILAFINLYRYIHKAKLRKSMF